MERKNYLVEEMTQDEKNYLKSAIKKAFLDFSKYIRSKNRLITYSIEDEYIQKLLPTVDDEYFIYDIKDIIGLVYSNIIFSVNQKEICVKQLEEIAVHLEIKYILRTLTFNEKLVFFLLEVLNCPVNKIANALSVTEKTVYNRNKSAKNKIEKEMEWLDKGV